jgi:hypothetical protein
MSCDPANLGRPVGRDRRLVQGSSHRRVKPKRRSATRTRVFPMERHTRRGRRWAQPISTASQRSVHGDAGSSRARWIADGERHKDCSTWAVPTSQPFHSAQPGQQVHHTNDECEAARAIEYYWIRHNDGHFPQCGTCASLDLASQIEKGIAPALPSANVSSRMAS